MGFNLFKKIGQSANKTFSKSNMRKTGGALTKGLGQVANVLGKVGSVGAHLLNNPLTQGIASMALGPEAGLALAGAGKLLNMANVGSKLAKTASNITNPKSYTSSNVLENLKDAKQRMEDLGNQASASAPVFA